MYGLKKTLGPLLKFFFLNSLIFSFLKKIKLTCCWEFDHLGSERIDDDILGTERARRVDEVGDEYTKYKEDDDDKENDYYISSDEKGFEFVNEVEHEWIDV